MRAILLAAALAAAPASAATRWDVRTSQGFDALCALNLLSGDDYYVKQYPDEARALAAPAYAEARTAARELKRVIKDEDGGIVSAFLTLVFSGGPDSSLTAVLESARHPARLEAAFRASPFWSEESWDRFQRVRPTVITALEAMHRAGFEALWEGYLGDPKARVTSQRAELARYDVLGEQERLIGHPLQSGHIEVVLLWFSRPHGIRIQGGRFLTNIGYPTTVVLRNATHEPLHPPFDASDSHVAAAIATLGRDPLIAAIVAKHDSSFGYNSVHGYVDEDAVQAMEQIVCERLGVAKPAADRWREADDGMHLLAAALYDLMKESGFAERGGRFQDWFVEQVSAGGLAPEEVERRSRAVVGDSLVERWKKAE
jgi:hypothetical protein